VFAETKWLQVHGNLTLKQPSGPDAIIYGSLLLLSMNSLLLGGINET
jgi:hypothetical protein